ncbi:MAG: copper resistance protein CopC [Mycobacteriales bacterium]
MTVRRSDAVPCPGSGAARRSRRVILGVLIGLTVLLWPTAAVAHPALVETTPGAGYAVTSPPEAVSVTFNEPVTPVGDALTLRRTGGASIPLAVEAQQRGKSLRGVPDEKLEAGSYEVSYRVVALDGDLVVGTFAFGVASPVAADSSAGTFAQDDPDEVRPGTALPRAVLFLGLSLALGGAVGAFIARRETGEVAATRPLTRLGSLLGLTGASLLLLQIGSLRPAALPGLLETSEPARLIAAEGVLFTVAMLGARAPWRGAVATAALTGVLLLEGVRAHPGEAVGSFGVVLTVVHLAAAAAWLGALVHVLRQALAWRDRSLATWMVAGAYARLAVALFLVVLATGTLSALLLLPTVSDWTGTTYGQVLLLKLGLLAAAVAAALTARIRHRRGVEDGRHVVDVEKRSPWALSRAARLEATLLVGVVIVTAGLTSATPPRLVSQQATLPAPTGAVVRVAERTNQVTVAVVASEGRLEARAYAPGPQDSVQYDLRLSVGAGSGQTRSPDLQPCGIGCWSAEVDWAEGLNVVETDVTASGWDAGRAQIEIRWPPRPAADLLRTVQTTMGAQAQIEATESVTSGFGAAPTTTSRRTGQEYLEDEPWSEGGVTDPITYTVDGIRTLAFAMPVLGYHFTMTLDEQDRVVDARVVTRKHLLQRSYRYPS